MLFTGGCTGPKFLSRLEHKINLFYIEIIVADIKTIIVDAKTIFVMMSIVFGHVGPKQMRESGSHNNKA